MHDVVIVAARRTAVGSFGGSLLPLSAEDLACGVIDGVLEQSGIDRAEVDEVILGQCRQSSDEPNIARTALLRCQIPVTASAYTVMRQCASGMTAVVNGAMSIMCGQQDIVLAGGTESMSNAIFYVRKARFGVGTGSTSFVDSLTEAQLRSQPQDVYGTFNMGMTAENVAEQYQITREEQDQFALASQQKAAAAIREGRFREEIVPLTVPQGRKKPPLQFDTDEFPRETSLEKLAKLKPVFRTDGKGTVTAGNSSGRNDGASALLLMSAERAAALGLQPLARIVGFGTSGVDPRVMGLGPVGATRKALERAGLSLQDIQLAELNEAFAAQSIACIRDLGLNPDIVNVNGGAIALGHPVGSSGARILVTLLYELRRRGLRYGLATLCIAGGMGQSIIIETI